MSIEFRVLGEEGGENLMVTGHGLGEAVIRDVVRRAGFGGIFDDITIGGKKVADGLAVAELHLFETWARETRGCPRHRRVPWRLRRALVVSVEWVRSQCFRLVWRLWTSRRDPLGDRRVPVVLRWLGSRWRRLSDCDVCEFVDHYRTCSGCQFCESDGSGVAPPWWDWAVPAGAPRDVNADRPGYLPVTIIDMAG